MDFQPHTISQLLRSSVNLRLREHRICAQDGLKVFEGQDNMPLPETRDVRKPGKNSSR